MKRIYLSGPMKGYPESNFPAFNATAAALRAKGLEVVNPAEIDPGVPEPEEGPEWKDFYNACMRADIKALLGCQVIALMPGWERSSGAQLELHIAHRVGLEVTTVGELLAHPPANELRPRNHAAEARYKHSVLLVANNEPDRCWALNIQSLPEPAVTLRGVAPTAEEMKRALQSLPVPIWMIDVCMVLAATAVRV